MDFVHRPGSVLSPSTGGVHHVFTPFSKVWSATPWDPWPEPGAARCSIPLPVAGLDPEAVPARARRLPRRPRARTARMYRLAAWLDAVRPLLRDTEPARRRPRDLPPVRRPAVGDAVAPDRGHRRRRGDPGPGRLLCGKSAWRDWYAHLFHGRPALARHAMKPSNTTS